MKSEKLPFEEDYFINSPISNYEDYRKRKFNVLAIDLIEVLGLRKDMKILDFGCATGGLLYEFKRYGFINLKGTDISYWSIDYGKETYQLDYVLEYFNVNLLTQDHDYLLLLDVLEHIPSITEINKYLKIANVKNVVVRIPVSEKEGEPYVLLVSRNDSTHVQCHTKQWWIDLFKKHNFELIKKLNTKSIYDSEGVFAGVFKKC
jgi:demethylmenaquinone methyltransferase/2-methoxy-6-polyprenyl-1,4-benzoquinol methylase